MTIKSFFALPPHGTPWTLAQVIKFHQKIEEKEGGGKSNENKKTKIIVGRLLFLRDKVGNTPFDSNQAVLVTKLGKVTINNLLRFLVEEKIISKVGKSNRRSFYYQFNQNIDAKIREINNRKSTKNNLKGEK